MQKEKGYQFLSRDKWVEWMERIKATTEVSTKVSIAKINEDYGINDSNCDEDSEGQTITVICIIHEKLIQEEFTP